MKTIQITTITDGDMHHFAILRIPEIPYVIPYYILYYISIISNKLTASGRLSSSQKERSR